MSGKNSITLKDAKEQFSTLLRSISDTDKKYFITFIFQELSQGGDDDFNDIDSDGSEKDHGLLDDPVATLNTIANDIRKRVPVSAILPSEKISTPVNGENADCHPDITEHVDEFLYDDDDIDDIVEEGKLQRNYCKDCGSKNIKPLIFISHSMSRDRLYYIFNNCLPTLEKETVLDIGSRLGAVLYGAYVFTDAPRIIGVEMNEDLCKLQNEIIHKYKMTDRIEVLHKKIEDCKDVVKSADVIIFNNSFEFYVSEETSNNIWCFLMKNIKPNATLITRPRLIDVFKNFDNLSLTQEKWAKPCKIEDEDETHDIGVYKIMQNI